MEPFGVALIYVYVRIVYINIFELFNTKNNVPLSRTCQQYRKHAWFQLELLHF